MAIRYISGNGFSLLHKMAAFNCSKGFLWEGLCVVIVQLIVDLLTSEILFLVVDKNQRLNGLRYIW